MKKRVLLVDDDGKLRKLLTEYLEGYGFQVFTLPDGSEVLEKIRAETPDMVILDIMLPQKDGLEVLREIRTESAVPIIMLTAKGEDEDRIVGLELGADDYLSKPFNPRELLARIKAVWRRLPHEVRAGSGARDAILVEAGGITLNKARQCIVVNNEEIELSSAEYKVLLVLMENPNRVMSRDRLMNLARGRDFMAFDRSIDVHISKLRAKLKTDPPSSMKIKTIWGTGYMFVDEGVKPK